MLADTIMSKKTILFLLTILLNLDSFATTNFSGQDKLKKKMKLKGDSLITAIYGEKFFNSSVTWSKDGSYIYSKSEAGKWTDKLSLTPNKFLLRYNVKLDNNTYNDLIEFYLDEQGHFIPNKYELIYGFEKVDDKIERVFKLKINEALTKAKALGLVETSENSLVSFLKWENFKMDQLYSGQFKFYIIQKTNSEKAPNSTEENFVMTNYFEVYSFSPWTGEFIEKKKMCQIVHKERYSGSSSALMDCK
jgi:hypothetical protein